MSAIVHHAEVTESEIEAMAMKVLETVVNDFAAESVLQWAGQGLRLARLLEMPEEKAANRKSNIFSASPRATVFVSQKFVS